MWLMKLSPIVLVGSFVNTGGMNYLFEDGSITQTLIGVKVPLHPGQFKAVRANIVRDGSAAPLSSKTEMAVNVTLDWNPGMSWDVEL